MEPYDLLWLGVDRDERPSHGKRIEDTLQRVVRVRLWEDEELKALADGELSFKQVTALRVMRIAGEAARRGMEERKICFITGMSKKVVREYLEFIEGNELISKGSNEPGGEGIIWTYYPQ